MTSSQESKHAHFKDKDAMSHVAEVQAKGMLSSAEIHGTEVPGHISAFADAAREMSISLLLIWTLLTSFQISKANVLLSLAVFSLGFSVWKWGRSAWLGWSRLERFHRILEQEKWEIEHHRPQEREELRVLYSTKGFEGKLLEDVLDVLMADDNRLLKIMVEEEMGLSLESHEHPLKQGLGAFLGSMIASCVCLVTLSIFPFYGLIAGSFLIMGIAAAMSAASAQNRWVPAIVWNVGLGCFSFGIIYFLLQFFRF